MEDHASLESPAALAERLHPYADFTPDAVAASALELVEAVAVARAARCTAWDLLVADALLPAAFGRVGDASAAPASASAEATLDEIQRLAGDTVRTLARRAEEDPA